IVLTFNNDPTIAEGKHRTFLHASVFFLVFNDTPATRLYIPVGGHVTDPFDATVLVAVIGRPIEMRHHTASDSSAVFTPKMSAISPSALCSSARMSRVTSSRLRSGLWW